MKYISARNKEEFDNCIEEFISDKSDKGIVFEVFTKKEEDARLQHEFYASQMSNMGKTKRQAKNIIKKVIGR